VTGRLTLLPKLLAAASLCIIGTAEVRAAPGPVRYACASRADLLVERNATSARVSIDGRTYDLQRKRSSIGPKYISRKAALIIDGGSAIFVSDDHPDLPACVQTVPIASER
jgi:membrane-bound inhibitor of C-type lysozyme